MTASPAFAANPGHTITITPESDPVTVRFNGEMVADTIRALRLQEASYPPVLYIPRDDLKSEHFTETSHQTKCPFKGTLLDADRQERRSGQRRLGLRQPVRPGRGNRPPRRLLPERGGDHARLTDLKCALRNAAQYGRHVRYVL
jgi:Domain of unknown function (DUF427)